MYIMFFMYRVHYIDIRRGPIFKNLKCTAKNMCDQKFYNKVIEFLNLLYVHQWRHPWEEGLEM